MMSFQLPRAPLAMVRLAVATALALCVLPGWAATYSYTSATYPSVTNFTACPDGDCQSFTTAMRVQGTLEVTALPANLVNTSIDPYLVAFNFADGLSTYASTDAQVSSKIRVTTDASGAITVLAGDIQRRQLAAPLVNGGRLDAIFLGANSEAAHNLSCTFVAGGQCNNFNVGAANGTSETASTPTTFALSVAAGVTSVPTLSEGAMLLLAGLLAAGAARMLRPSGR